MARRINGLQKYRREASERMDKALDRAAHYIADLAQQLAPKDEGDLASTVRVEGEPGTKRRVVKVGGMAGPNKYVDYAPPVEYGTDTSPAQPFFTPAREAIDVKAEIRAELLALAEECLHP